MILYKEILLFICAAVVFILAIFSICIGVADLTPKDVFQKVTFLKEKQLGVPKITEFALELQEKGYSFESLPITIEEFVEVLVHG